MCGIAGYWDADASPPADALRAVAARMSATLSHRGPDGDGTWVDETAGIALGHRRLAVVDLSEHGRQPMVSSSGRYVLTYNGELYNAAELRAAVLRRGGTFRGHSDTEVLLETCETRGVEEALLAIRGMFAFAVWDRHQRVLTLARDRMGIKPLYYAVQGRRVMFASELKALREVPGAALDVDPEALQYYFTHLYVPAPSTVFRGVSKLAPGTAVRIGDALECSVSPYWRLSNVAGGRPGADGTTWAQAVEHVDDAIGDAVERQLVADVPVGAFLSGGVDSSCVVAHMVRRSGRPVRTFTIAYAEQAFDESGHARRVAQHLGTQHESLLVRPDDVRSLLPELPFMYDEPFADASQLPSVLVSRLARSEVTVCLSGDGGDELFGGYPRYARLAGLWRRQAWVPRPVGRAIARVLGSLSPESWNRLLQWIPRGLRPLQDARQSVPELIRYLGARNIDEVYASAVHAGASDLLRDAPQVGPRWQSMGPPLDGDAESRLLYFDLVSLLPDALLVKVDRASMSVGLEVRVPLLDESLVETVLGLPRELLLRDFGSKRLLRDVLARYVPTELVERPKMGFHVPMADWMRGPLREWAESHLEPHRLRETGVLDATRVRSAWSRIVDGSSNRYGSVWAVLMFMAWQRRWG